MRQTEPSSDPGRVTVMAGRCGCTKYYDVKEELDPLCKVSHIF